MFTTTISGGYYAPLAAAAANSTTSTPDEAGTLDITASVTVVYALKYELYALRPDTRPAAGFLLGEECC